MTAPYEDLISSCIDVVTAIVSSSICTSASFSCVFSSGQFQDNKSDVEFKFRPSSRDVTIRLLAGSQTGLVRQSFQTGQR